MGEKYGSKTLEIAGCVTLAVLYLLTALSMKLLCPLQYQPKTFHIPDVCMPWLPAVAIGLVFFGCARACRLQGPRERGGLRGWARSSRTGCRIGSRGLQCHQARRAALTLPFLGLPPVPAWPT